jgi:hypothetical protein
MIAMSRMIQRVAMVKLLIWHPAISAPAVALGQRRRILRVVSL